MVEFTVSTSELPLKVCSEIAEEMDWLELLPVVPSVTGVIEAGEPFTLMR